MKNMTYNTRASLKKILILGTLMPSSVTEAVAALSKRHKSKFRSSLGKAAADRPHAACVYMKRL